MPRNTSQENNKPLALRQSHSSEYHSDEQHSESPFELTASDNSIPTLYELFKAREEIRATAETRKGTTEQAQRCEHPSGTPSRRHSVLSEHIRHYSLYGNSPTRLSHRLYERTVINNTTPRQPQLRHWASLRRLRIPGQYPEEHNDCLDKNSTGPEEDNLEIPSLSSIPGTPAYIASSKRTQSIDTETPLTRSAQTGVDLYSSQRDFTVQLTNNDTIESSGRFQSSPLSYNIPRGPWVDCKSLKYITGSALGIGESLVSSFVQILLFTNSIRTRHLMPLKVFGNIFWNSQPPEAASKEPQQAKRESGLFLPVSHQAEVGISDKPTSPNPKLDVNTSFSPITGHLPSESQARFESSRTSNIEPGNIPSYERSRNPVDHRAAETGPTKTLYQMPATTPAPTHQLPDKIQIAETSGYPNSLVFIEEHNIGHPALTQSGYFNAQEVQEIISSKRHLFPRSGSHKASSPEEGKEKGGHQGNRYQERKPSRREARRKEGSLSTVISSNIPELPESPTEGALYNGEPKNSQQSQEQPYNSLTTDLQSRTVDIISRVKASTQQTAHNEPHDVPPPTTAANTTMADVESAQRIDHWVRGQQQSPPPPPGPITSSRDFIRAILAGHPGSTWGWAAHALVRVPQATLSFGVTWLLAAARIAFPHRAWPGALTAVWVLGYASAGWAAGAWVAFQVVHAGRGHGAWRRKWGRWFVLVDGAACALWLGGIVLTALVVGRPDVDTYSAFFEENRLRDEDDAGGKKGDNSGDGTGGWTKSEEKIARSIFAVVFYFHIALFVLYFICTLYNLGARTWWYQKLCRCLNPKKHDDDDDDVGKVSEKRIITSSSSHFTLTLHYIHPDPTRDQTKTVRYLGNGSVSLLTYKHRHARSRFQSHDECQNRSHNQDHSQYHDPSGHTQDR